MALSGAPRADDEVLPMPEPMATDELADLVQRVRGDEAECVLGQRDELDQEGCSN